MPRRSSSTVKVFYPTWTREELVALLRQRLPALRQALPVTRVVLFGSYATGRHTVASDVDLLVVYAGPRREDAYERVRGSLGIPRLEPHVYTEHEYGELRQTVERMIHDGVAIFEAAHMRAAPSVRTQDRSG